LSSPSDQRRVLVVDDEVDLIVTYVRLLQRQGYRVVTAGTRGEALAIVERQPLRLVISDLRLPDGDGLDVVRAATVPSRGTPAIVVTGFSSGAARMAAFEAGASAFLAKPFSAPRLMAAVHELSGPACPA